MDSEMNDFLEQLLDEKGYQTLEGEVREEVKAGMAERLLDQIDRALIYVLPEDKAAELAKLVDDPNFDQKQMLDFIAKSGVDTSAIIAKTMLQFRAFYLADSEPSTTSASTASEPSATNTSAAAESALTTPGA